MSTQKQPPQPVKNPKAYLFVAILAALPHAYAEYRRYNLGGTLDATYWLLSALILVSVWCLYRVIRPSVNGKKNDPTEDACNAAVICCFIVAVYAFLVSGIVRLIG
ncbi:MAG: hypothetical protein E7620_01245 [Ruminococcaceae bacterium]|nr:hypothetical protein [Oscillospiraceae bacterium]